MVGPRKRKRKQKQMKGRQLQIKNGCKCHVMINIFLLMEQRKPKPITILTDKHWTGWRRFLHFTAIPPSVQCAWQGQSNMLPVCFSFFFLALWCIYHLLHIKRHTCNVTFRPSTAQNEISLAQKLNAYKMCTDKCVDRAYAVLFILRNTVLNDCEIKSAVRGNANLGAVRPPWDSWFADRTGSFFMS